MTRLTHDGMPVGRGASGFALAVVSAASFGLSGALARGLIEAGWTPGSAVLVRVWVAALVLLVPGVTLLLGGLVAGIVLATLNAILGANSAAMGAS